jgi:MFS family permease
VLRTHDLVLTSGGLTLMIASSALSQLAAPPLAARRAIVLGLVILTGGLAMLIAAAATRSLLLSMLAMLGCGLGHGLVFAGTLREVMVAAEPTERGSLVATIYLVNYCGLGNPAIATGLLALRYGLLAATQIIAGVIAILSGAMTLMWLANTEPAAPHTP